MESMRLAGVFVILTPIPNNNHYSSSTWLVYSCVNFSSKRGAL